MVRSRLRRRSPSSRWLRLGAHRGCSQAAELSWSLTPAASWRRFHIEGGLARARRFTLLTFVVLSFDSLCISLGAMAALRFACLQTWGLTCRKSTFKKETRRGAFSTMCHELDLPIHDPTRAFSGSVAVVIYSRSFSCRRARSDTTFLLLFHASAPPH